MARRLKGVPSECLRPVRKLAGGADNNGFSAFSILQVEFCEEFFRRSLSNALNYLYAGKFCLVQMGGYNVMNLPLIILASASPRRAELLSNMGVEFQTIVSHVEEIHHDQITAGEAAQVNAYRKTRVVAKKFPDALVIGADTFGASR